MIEASQRAPQVHTVPGARVFAFRAPSLSGLSLSVACMRRDGRVRRFQDGGPSV